MGAYLSEPKTTKDSLDSDGVYVRCGASSMQGWRISQEVSCFSQAFNTFYSVALFYYVH